MDSKEPNAFPMVDGAGATTIYVDDNDLNTVKKAVSCVVLQKITVTRGDEKPNYLGAPETRVFIQNPKLDNFPVPNRKDYPLLFDVNHQPKKAFWEIVKFQ